MTSSPVLVAGAGTAGLAAALATAQAEVEVVIAERSQHFRYGSNSAMSTAMIPAGGSAWQVAAGIDDSPEQFLSDMTAATNGSVDPTVAGALTSIAPELVDWLENSCGVPLELVTDFNYPGHSALRCHTVPDRSGRTLLKHLISAVSQRPNITLVTPLELTRVFETGTGLSGELTSQDRTSEVEEFSAIILATNGYGGDKALVAEHIPSMAGAYYHGGEGSKGDAIRIGLSLGAEIGFLDSFQGHGSLAMPHAILLTWAVMVHGGVIVNSQGRRFGDESGSYSGFAQKTLAQPEGFGWAVFDTRIGDLCGSFADYQDLLAVNAVHKAETIDQLAALINCEPATLSGEFELVAAAREGHRKDIHGRSDFGRGLRAPYLAVRITGALFHTQGGLVVDQFARVQRKNGPISGLYAVGGAAVGASGHGADGYLAGNGLLAALGLGYLAGTHAGRYVMK